MIIVTDKELVLSDVLSKLKPAKGVGSVVAHAAVVKPTVDRKSTRGIRFTPVADVEAEMHALEDGLRAEWEVSDVLLIRRIGNLVIGDIISAAAAAAVNYETAFKACRDAIERFKKMKSLAKEELFE
jgi:molybdopterin synthase catalytic subunit